MSVLELNLVFIFWLFVITCPSFVFLRNLVHMTQVFAMGETVYVLLSDLMNITNERTGIKIVFLDFLLFSSFGGVKIINLGGYGTDNF